LAKTQHKSVVQVLQSRNVVANNYNPEIATQKTYQRCRTNEYGEKEHTKCSELKIIKNSRQKKNKNVTFKSHKFAVGVRKNLPKKEACAKKTPFS
jgi:hypothetical protein